MSSRKQRPTKVDEFRSSLSPESDAELLRIADLPNVKVSDIYQWLLSQGFKGSLSGTYTWYENHRKEGEKAKVFNEMLKSYNGVSVEPALLKLVVVLSKQLDNVTTVLDKDDIKLDPRESLRQLANIGRELRGCITSYNELQTIRDRKGLEIAGAQRMAQELRSCFADSPFLDAVEEAIKGALILIEEDG
jgi:hypothetical protein